ncbi:MAG: 50S ribosomal protein L3 [Candidatus Diapherotrites archaeon]|nr:50S ribosomal protein L3 [Candidatus Diapherotrites archaeon]
MTKKSRPHAGSKAFYPRKKARKETPSFRTFPKNLPKECKPLNFLGYKAGMTHILARDAHNKGVTFGQEVAVPATVIEVPALKIFGVRAYKKSGYGSNPITDIFAEKVDREIERKIHSFKKKGKKKKEKPAKYKTFSDLEKEKEKISDIKLLALTQPKQAGLPKKTPDICEIALSGTIDEKISFAKDRLGKELPVSDVFKELQFVDVRAVTKGKGTQGPVKRFGVKMHRPKAKKRRIVGSIGPWNPSTVMWQVARAGQMGYQNRTEYNKKILKISSSAEDIAEATPASGFKHYGNLKTSFVLLTGSIPGPAKRAVGLRLAVRAPSVEKHKLEGIDYIATSKKKSKVKIEVEAQKVKAEEEKKVEKKSVEDEIAAAVKGEKK